MSELRIMNNIAFALLSLLSLLHASTSVVITFKYNDFHSSHPGAGVAKIKQHSEVQESRKWWGGVGWCRAGGGAA